MGWDTGFTYGTGENTILYLENADKKNYKIIKLRKIEKMEKTDYPIKGYVKIGEQALDYLEKKAKNYSAYSKEASNYSFVVYGVIRKSGARVNFGKGPQVVIEIDKITKD